MSKKNLSESTIIQIGASIPQGLYFDFFRETTGKDLFYGEHGIWLKSQAGKTIGEALASYQDASKTKNMEQKLLEERFNILSEPDKAFIIAFDKTIEDLGYDYGGGIGDGYGWGKYMIIYGKTGTKSRPCPARIYIKENGAVLLRLFFKNIDKHRQYIEESPSHIKEAFAFEGGDCKSCMPTCKTMKVYTIDERQYNKCCHSTAYFSNPSVEKMPDYMALYSRFNPAKKTKIAK
jgi:hypothetical protein